MSLRTGKHRKISLKKNAEALDTAPCSISPSVSKLHQTLEKKTERGRHKPTGPDWNFTRFAAIMLDVLTILHEQDRLKIKKAKRQFTQV